MHIADGIAKNNHDPFMSPASLDSCITRSGGSLSPNFDIFFWRELVLMDSAAMPDVPLKVPLLDDAIIGMERC